jgi:hypothetical protein
MALALVFCLKPNFLVLHPAKAQFALVRQHPPTAWFFGISGALAAGLAY